jgi:hypothetical protein
MIVLARRSVFVGIFLLGAVVGAALVLMWTGLFRPDPAPVLPRRLEATIYLPTRGNTQKPFSEEDWHNALKLLVVEFGGATLGAPVEGYWLDGNGQLQREPVRPVIISFEREKLERFREIVHQVGRKLGQETIYTRFEEPRVELLPVRPDSFQKDR